MSFRILKWLGLICGSVLIVALAFFGYFVMNSGKDKDHLLRQAVSPDGKLKAEIHQNITPMHGGPDTLRVTIAPVDAPFGDVVYSRTYECADHGAFQIQQQFGKHVEPYLRDMHWSRKGSSPVNRFQSGSDDRWRWKPR